MKWFIVSLNFLEKVENDFVDICLTLKLQATENTVKEQALSKFMKILKNLGLNPETLSQLKVEEL
jgi:hypothetical protein